MKKGFVERLNEKVVLFDGAMGTELIARGLKDGECPELWNVEKPDAVKSIHKAYLDAGADVVLTNTFGGTPPKLAKYGLEERTAEINSAAVKLAKSVLPGDRYVAGDMGPTGLFLPPMGKASEEDFYNAYLQQSKALADAGADLLIIETQYDLREALQALKAAKTTGLPVVVCLTYDRKKRGYFTIVGDKPSAAAVKLAANGADVVGANCSLSSVDYEVLLKELKESAITPVLVQPNAGQPEMEDGKVFYKETAEEFTGNLMKLVDAGADAIGSCCGSNPKFTAAIAKALKLRTAKV